MDAALIEEAKAVAKAYKIPFVQLVVAGMEAEIERIKKELRK